MKLWVSNDNYVEFAENTDAMKPALEEIATLDKNPAMDINASLLPNPDPVLIKEGLRIEVFESLENDSEVGTSIEMRKNAVTGLEEAVEQGESPDPVFELVNKIYTDFLKTEMINNAMLDFRLNGYRVMEINWKEYEQYIVPGEIVARDYEFFKFNPAGRLMFCTKENKEGVDAELSFPNKFVLLRNLPTPKNPYGKAILSSIFWNVAFKRGGMKFWTLLMEKFGIPATLIEYPPSMTKPKIRDMVLTVAETVLDRVVAVPFGSKVSFHEVNVSGASDAHLKYVEQQDKYIRKRILGHSSVTEATPGKLGNDDNAENGFSRLIQSDAKELMAIHNEIIRKIVDINFGIDVTAPTYALYSKKNKNLIELAEVHTKVYALGYDIAPERLRADFGYDESDLIKRENAAPAALASGTEFNDAIIKHNEKENTLVSDTVTALSKAKNYTEAEQNIISSLLENPQQFADKLTASLFFANAAGRIQAEKEAL